MAFTNQGMWPNNAMANRVPPRSGMWPTAPIEAGAPYSFPGSRPSAPWQVRPVPGSWSQAYVRNEDYGNLVSKGYGSPYQGDHPIGSPTSDQCCSPTNEPAEGWISPMDDQPVYLSPVHFQSQPTPTWAGFMHAPSFGATSQGSSNVSDSEEETASVTRSPDSVPHVYMSGPYQPSQMMQQHVHRPMAPSQQTNLFDMDLDEPSTTAADDEDEEEETTVDDELVFDDSMGSDHLDTTVDYSYLHGAVESPLDLDDFPVVTLNASKTPCLDALAFCVVLRLGAHQTPEDEQEGSITITNFQKLLGGIHLFCPKKSQTANEEARIKALKRWFDGIPTKRKRDTVFIMRIKDRKNPVVMQIIKKLQTFCITHGFVRALNPATQQALRPGA